MDRPPAGAIEWPALELEIPTTSPAAVAAPAYASWIDLARANRAALDGATIEVAGVRLGDLRRAARAEVLQLAAAYTRSLGHEVPAFGSDLVLATGHQPILVHPGIWIKYLALARLIPPGGAGLNVIVDSDATDEIAAEVPRANGRLARARVTLASPGPEVPAELLPAPTADHWREFASAVDAHLATMDEPAVAEGWRRARRLLPGGNGAGPPGSVTALPGAVTALRRALEGSRPYLDLPVSHLARTASFRRFATSILQDAHRFAELHNVCLAAYRAHYGVRTAAQPFPDLEMDDAEVEAPFWYVDEGRRWPLFVDVRARRLIARGRDVGSLPHDPDEAAFAATPLRPRALMLTAFTRLLVADLFIHGIGGGRYDRATNAIIREFWGIIPPVYVIATATLFLPFADPAPPDEERRRLHRTLLDLQHNPDRFLSSDAGPHRALVAEKWSLIRQLEGTDALTRRQRRQTTQRIREINLILQVAVADRVAAAQEALRHSDLRQEDAEVTGYRGYPFMLFPVESVEALVDALGA